MSEQNVNDAASTNGSEDKEFVVVERPTARVVLPTDVGDDTDSEEEVIDGEELESDVDPLADFPDDTEELELVHSRISSLNHLRLERFAKHLKKLCLRQNQISELDPATFSLLTELEELDLYDNKVKHVGQAIDKLSKLSVLDLSFNLIRQVPDGLSSLSSLHTVFFVQNKISKISGLDSVGRTLRSLELGGNRIRFIENLDSLVNLEELWLGKNKITKLQNLSSLKSLKILSIQSNRIKKIEGLDGLSNLQELYLSHNGVERLEGLDNNPQLRTLDVGNNFIPEIENVSHLTSLEELWLNNNKIDSLQALEPQLKKTETLETIYLEGNPCQQTERAAYRRKIIIALPQVTQIDATFAKAL
ncbi:L domain-like protein [Coniophora puteana RWD-64-598 SS2]|uniref:L domain-like protein n=1 Tax=Coniophora puteana (strain RWD-64-598) TaxID=741705 RepID=A0A5M3MXZ3_CONPW|nr:L domain-like protein [Coniophora puteana RWD-64-598 SS2]EIW83980.1 L domain-like protein [Coniophora puteana RWD-64-598 SS2]